mgnify:CR=1 FL=1
MEILNEIWNNLTGTNEVLTNIFVSVGIFFESYLIMSLFISILGIEVSNKRKITYICITSIVSILSMLLFPSPINTLLNYIIMIILSILFFKTSFIKSSLCILLFGIILNIIGALVLNPYLTIVHITSQQLQTTPIYRLIYMIILYFIAFIIVLVIKNRKLRINFSEELDSKSKYIIVSNILLGIVTIIIQSLLAFYYVDKLPLIFTFLSFISLLLYFGLSIYSLTSMFKLVQTSKELQSAEEYNNTLRILHDNVRGFKHDFDNIITTIGGYIQTNDMEGLKKYYNQLEDDCERVNNLYILNPEVVKNNGIYNLLTTKYYEADSKDIKVNISFLIDLSKLNMKIYEFARILGILIDNAIDASSECDEKIINLIFRDEPKNHRQIVIVENTYKDKNIDTEKIFEKGVSGKEHHTGLGLWEVRKILKKNSNVNLFTTKSDKFFTQQLEIYY